MCRELLGRRHYGFNLFIQASVFKSTLFLDPYRELGWRRLLCGLLGLLEPPSDVRLVHLDAALVEHPLVSLMPLLRRFHFFLLSFMVITFTLKVFLVKSLDKKLKLFFVFFLEVGERVLAAFEDVIQRFQLVVLAFRGRIGSLMVLAACERMLLRLLPIGSFYFFGLLFYMKLYESSRYRWVGACWCKE